MANDGGAATGEVRAMAITVASASLFITFSRPTEARVLLRRPVLDDEWLTETLRQPLTDQAGKHVDHAARGKAGDQAHRPRRIGLRPSEARRGRQPAAPAARWRKFRRGSFIMLLP